ncbi:MAG: OmpH family outer membrane protein [Acidaminococcaceae bacterium]|nr:OmpH family outer membrane protein [Acidaminococcaceae bacterium]
MMELANKKNVKVISLSIAAIFILGMFALGLTQSGIGGSSSNAVMESAIGTVNYQELIQNAPGIGELQNSMNSAVKTAQTEFAEKSKGMNDSDKQKLMKQYQEQLSTKKKELLEPIKKKGDAAIFAVGRKKGLAVVVDKSVVVYGGLDVNSDVNTELKK